MIVKVGELFGLHALALEDVVHVHQRAKVEEYDNHLFVVARMVSMNERVCTEQLSLFLGKNFVVTFQERVGDCFEPVRGRIRSRRQAPIRDFQADYLAYALLDAIVDAYFPILDEYGQRLDLVEDEIAQDTSTNMMERIHDLRSDVRVLSRAVWPQREVVRKLLDEHGHLISAETRVYLRDLYDHTIQIVELLETYRESCADLRDFYMSAVSNRMNEIMKVLTIIATIFIPLSFIAGVYGMNFDEDVSRWNMPELRSPYGYPAVLGLMSACAVGMLFFFRRKGWIGHRSNEG
jgi:magnesium transporter